MFVSTIRASGIQRQAYVSCAMIQWADVICIGWISEPLRIPSICRCIVCTQLGTESLDCITSQEGKPDMIHLLCLASFETHILPKFKHSRSVGTSIPDRGSNIRQSRSLGFQLYHSGLSVPSMWAVHAIQIHPAFCWTTGSRKWTMKFAR